MMILKQQPNQLISIIKRDGRTDVFDEEKIIEAIRKSFQATGEFQSYNYYRDIASGITKLLKEILPCPLWNRFRILWKKSL